MLRSRINNLGSFGGRELANYGMRSAECELLNSQSVLDLLGDDSVAWRVMG
jgi:hypothetical protein